MREREKVDKHHSQWQGRDGKKGRMDARSSLPWMYLNRFLPSFDHNHDWSVGSISSLT